MSLKSYNILMFSRFYDGGIDACWSVNEETCDFLYKAPNEMEAIREYIRVLREESGVTMMSGDNCFDDAKWNTSTKVYEDYINMEDPDIVMEVFFPVESGIIKDFDDSTAKGTSIEASLKKLKLIYGKWDGNATTRPFLGPQKKYKGYPIYETGIPSQYSTKYFKNKTIGYVPPETKIPPIAPGAGYEHPFFKDEFNDYRVAVNTWFLTLKTKDKLYPGINVDTKEEDYCYLYKDIKMAKQYPFSIPDYIFSRDLEEEILKKEISFEGIDPAVKRLMNSVMPMHGQDCCPKCGNVGKWVRASIVCETHGRFGGL
jgi:hypothetical protein